MSDSGLFIRSSRADKKFDTTVGHIEDIIMGKVSEKPKIRPLYSTITLKC